MGKTHLLFGLDPTMVGYLCALIASLLLTGKCVFQLIFGKQNSRVWIERCSVVGAVFVTSVLAADVILEWLAEASTVMQLWVAALTFMVVLATVWLNVRFSSLRLAPRAILYSPVAWLALICSMGTVEWSGLRVYKLVTVSPDVAWPIFVPGIRKQLPQLVAVTDRGSEMILYRWDVPQFLFDKYASTISGKANKIFAVMSRTPADHESNCHGWVFTDGRFHLSDNSVQRILDDNGYEVVNHPRPDDLIIYRDAGETIVHSGLVRGVLSDGTVMVESKWGMDGQFLHQPMDQPFGDQFAYYRSHRQGHFVDIRAPRVFNIVKMPGPISQVEDSRHGAVSKSPDQAPIGTPPRS